MELVSASKSQTFSVFLIKKKFLLFKGGPGGATPWRKMRFQYKKRMACVLARPRRRRTNERPSERANERTPRPRGSGVWSSFLLPKVKLFRVFNEKEMSSF